MQMISASTPIMTKHSVWSPSSDGGTSVCSAVVRVETVANDDSVVVVPVVNIVSSVECEGVFWEVDAVVAEDTNPVVEEEMGFVVVLLVVEVGFAVDEVVGFLVVVVGALTLISYATSPIALSAVPSEAITFRHVIFIGVPVPSFFTLNVAENNCVFLLMGVSMPLSYITNILSANSTIQGDTASDFVSTKVTWFVS